MRTPDRKLWRFAIPKSSSNHARSRKKAETLFAHMLAAVSIHSTSTQSPRGDPLKSSCWWRRFRICATS